jgi:uncharacterized protein (DUF433 family)
VVKGLRLDRITIDPNRMRGLPCIRDTRVTVSAVLGQLGGCRTVDQVLADYSYLDHSDILAALAYAAIALSESAKLNCPFGKRRLPPALLPSGRR